MRILSWALAVIGLVSLGAGCGGSSGKAGNSLDCAYLASDTNCWKTTAAMAVACLPAQSEIGTLSADGKTCTYATGDVVTFTPPLVLPLSNTATTMTWNFVVTTSSGAPCLAYQDDGNGKVMLKVQSETVTETTPGGLGITLTCPDGVSYSNSNAFNLLSCPDASFLSSLPGAGYSESGSTAGSSISLSLIGVGGAYGSEPVFNCQTAP